MRRLSAVVVAGAAALGGCDRLGPWPGFTREEVAVMERYDHRRAVAVCERNLSQTAGDQRLTAGASTPIRGPDGRLLMTVAFHAPGRFPPVEHHCLVDPTIYAVIEWRTPMLGGEHSL